MSCPQVCPNEPSLWCLGRGPVSQAVTPNLALARQPPPTARGSSTQRPGCAHLPPFCGKAWRCSQGGKGGSHSWAVCAVLRSAWLSSEMKKLLLSNTATFLVPKQVLLHYREQLAVTSGTFPGWGTEYTFSSCSQFAHWQTWRKSL